MGTCPLPLALLLFPLRLPLTLPSQSFSRNGTGVSARAMGGALFVGAATLASPLVRALSQRPLALDAEEAGLRVLGNGSLPLGLGAAFALLVLFAGAPAALLHTLLSCVRNSAISDGLGRASAVARLAARVGRGVESERFLLLYRFLSSLSW